MERVQATNRLTSNSEWINMISTEVKTMNPRASLLRAKSISGTPQDWHVEDIKAAIRKTGLTLSDLSLAAGFCGGAAKCALRMPWPRMEAAIAAHLGRKPHEIWPSRYSPDGRPLAGLHIRRPKNLAPATPPRNVRKVRSNEQRAYA
jgi:Ner family transcriptional regulator